MNDYFDSIKRRDPAARNALQMIFVYPSIHALFWYRIANFLYRHNLKLIGEVIMFMVRCCLNIEIHPGATIGKRLFIDHGTGVVIGQTAIIGNDVTIFHGVTLGASGKPIASTKRHPTVEDYVVVGAGAKVLGDITLGSGSKVGANAVVLQNVPSLKTAVGIPAKIK